MSCILCQGIDDIEKCGSAFQIQLGYILAGRGSTNLYFIDKPESIIFLFIFSAVWYCQKTSCFTNKLFRNKLF